MKDAEETIKVKIHKMKVLEEDIEDFFGKRHPTDDDLVKSCEITIRQIQELAYRRGASHGFTFGCEERTSEELKRVKQKMLIWRRDLEMTGGIPGSPSENTEMGKV